MDVSSDDATFNVLFLLVHECEIYRNVYHYGNYFTVSSHDPDGPVTSSHTELERKLTSSSISSQDSALGECEILCNGSHGLQNSVGF